MLLQSLVTASEAVERTSSRKQKIARLAECLRQAGPEVDICVAYLCGEPRQGKLGIGYRTLGQVRPARAAEQPTLTLGEVHAEFDALKATTGKGSQQEKGRRLEHLLARASPSEQRFLLRLLAGELRQGALEAILLEAVAEAANIDPGALRRALMFAGDLQELSTLALTEGAPALSRYRVELFRPLRPMLAQTTGSAAEALQHLGPASVEYKLDGARVQLHKAGDEVRVFSRHMNDVSERVPEILELGRRLPVRDLVLDGEAIALGPGGRPLPFQVTMRRFGRKLDVAEARKRLPLSVFLFDVLHLEGQDLIDEAYATRLARLEPLAPQDAEGSWRGVPHLLGPTPAQVATFSERALEEGHEGVMLKALASGYEAGRRGAAWLKLKPVHTLDLVVLAAEWGSGRRQGFLSNLHLGARDPKSGGFVMLGKTFKGLTDELLSWQTAEFLKREIARDSCCVHIKPELVVEIAFDGLQRSPQYPGGLALRFARVKRYRSDKTALEADSIDTVRALYARSHGAGQSRGTRGMAGSS